MITLNKSGLSDAECRKLAEDLARDIKDAGGLEAYYNWLFGEGAFLRDSVGFIPEHKTVQ